MSSPLIRMTGTVTCPAGTPTYAAGDLIANSATAGLVTPMTFQAQSVAAAVRNVTIRKTGTGLTNASFYLWLLSVSPTMASGDDAAIDGPTLASIICEPIRVDCVVACGSVGAVGTSLFDSKTIKLDAMPVYGLLTAAASYTRIASEVFTVDLVCEAL